MQKIKLVGVETCNPKPRWTQAEVLENVEKSAFISRKAKVFYKRFLSDKGIHTRHFGMEALDSVNTESPDAANQRFAQVATAIGAEAVRKCLEQTKLGREEVDALIITTCTGYLCPGLTSYVSEKLGLKDSIYALDLAGLGCGAAIPALRVGHQYLQAHPGANVIVASVEVCSAALSWGDEIDLILSNVLFSDGAAACLLSDQPNRGGYEILNFESLLWPEYREDLRFSHKDSRLRNVIKRSVPQIAGKAVKNLDDKLKRKLGSEPEHYGIHPGGRRVIDEIQDALGLEEALLEPTRAVLREYGNMSSPSILYVLKTLTEKDRPKKDAHVALFAFGAGFTAFGTVLKSDGFEGDDVWTRA